MESIESSNPAENDAYIGLSNRAENELKGKIKDAYGVENSAIDKIREFMESKLDIESRRSEIHDLIIIQESELDELSDKIDSIEFELVECEEGYDQAFTIYKNALKDRKEAINILQLYTDWKEKSFILEGTASGEEFNENAYFDAMLARDKYQLALITAERKTEQSEKEDGE